MSVRQIGRRGLVAGVVALVGAGLAKLAGPQQADAAVTPVQTDTNANSTTL